MAKVMIIVDVPADEAHGRRFDLAEQHVRKLLEKPFGGACVICSSVPAPWKVDMFTGLTDYDYTLIERAMEG